MILTDVCSWLCHVRSLICAILWSAGRRDEGFCGTDGGCGCVANRRVYLSRPKQIGVCVCGISGCGEMQRSSRIAWSQLSLLTVIYAVGKLTLGADETDDMMRLVLILHYTVVNTMSPRRSILQVCAIPARMTPRSAFSTHRRRNYL